MHEKIEVYMYSEALVLLTPNRRYVSVKVRDGYWERTDLAEAFKSIAQSHKEIHIAENHTPYVWLDQFDTKKGLLLVSLQTNSLVSKKVVTLKMSDDGKNLSVVAVSDKGKK